MKRFAIFLIIVVLAKIYNPLMAEPVAQVERSRDEATAIRQSPRPSNVNPIASVSSMENMTVKLGRGIDLSKYSDNMEIVLGYGVYDTQDEHCIYVDRSQNKNMKTEFESFLTSNNKTYAAAKNKLSFGQCQAIAAKYGGYVFVPDNPYEQALIVRNYVKGKGNGWIGLSRSSCDTSEIISQSNRIPSNISISNNSVCSNGQINLSLKDDGLLYYTPSASLNLCIVEIDSPDYTKPKKICAPWWRIERSYPNLWYKEDVERIKENGTVPLFDPKIFSRNMPIKMNLCLKTDIDPNCFDENGKPKTYTATCTTYYDITRSPRCADDPKQDLCFVNECAGSLEKQCELIDTIEPVDDVKSYTKIHTPDGTENKKRAIDITTRVYSCKKCVQNIWSKCKEKVEVQIWGQYCDDNKTIIYPKNEYANMVFDNAGNLTALKATCPSGHTVFFNVGSEISTQARTCSRWDIRDTVREQGYRCTTQRDTYNRSVMAGTGERDIYSDNPNCLRANTIEEARPKIDYSLNVQKGDTRLTGFHLMPNSKPNKIIETKDPLDRINAYIKRVEEIKQNTKKVEFGKPKVENKPICEKFNTNWQEKLLMGAAMSENNQLSAIPQFLAINKDKKAFLYKNATISDCNEIAGNVGGTPIFRTCATGYDFNRSSNFCQRDRNASGCRPDEIDANYACLDRKIYNTENEPFESWPIDVFSIKSLDILHEKYNASKRGVCLIDAAKEPSDIFQKGVFDGASKQITLNTAIAMDREICKETAECFGGKNIQNNDGSCGVVIDMDEKEIEEPEATAGFELPPLIDSNEKPIDLENAVLEGTGILYFTEIVDGNGIMHYGSTYHTKNIRPYKLKVNNKLLHPINNSALEIKEELDYRWNVYERRVKSGKMEDLTPGAIGGAASVSVAHINPSVAIALAGASAIVAIWGKYQNYGQVDIEWSLSRPYNPNKIYTNEYGNTLDPTDLRTFKDNVNYYHHARYSTGYSKSSVVERTRDILYQNKLRELHLAGYSILSPEWRGNPHEAIAERDLFRTGEKKWSISNASKCKWYKPPSSCRKTKTGRDEGHEKRYRLTAGFWTEATNALTIVVPYRGNWEVSAYDKWGNKLANTRTTTDGFVDFSGNNYKAHPIAFGTQMTLSNGHSLQPFNSEADACRNHTMVEWGGGVSGIYYEQSNCGKSNDSYTKDHAATKIVLRPIGADGGYEIPLEKPMPYANRITLVTFDYNENREYKCFTEVKKCEPPKEFH